MPLNDAAERLIEAQLLDLLERSHRKRHRAARAKSTRGHHATALCLVPEDEFNASPQHCTIEPSAILDRQVEHLNALVIDRLQEREYRPHATGYQQRPISGVIEVADAQPWSYQVHSG